MDKSSPVQAASQTPAQSALSIPRSLFLFAILYGGMVPLGGFLGAKQVALGPLAVEAGIFPFLTLVAISSATCLAPRNPPSGTIPPYRIANRNSERGIESADWAGDWLSIAAR